MLLFLKNFMFLVTKLQSLRPINRTRKKGGDDEFGFREII